MNCYMLAFVAASGNLCSSRTIVGSKRNWKVANEKSAVHTTAPSSSSSTLTSPAEKGTSRHLLNLGDHLSSGWFIDTCLSYCIIVVVYCLRENVSVVLNCVPLDTLFNAV